jgi:fengycin family lipopeptide synthetase D
MENLPNKIPIGRPINNTQIYLLDKEMELVPAGIPGELYIGGFNIANGYINHLDWTTDRFIQNPFGEGKLYKSGDVAKWDNIGVLEFLGRDDGQVKVRGYRIELGEIESCMLKYPNLKEAAVKLIDEADYKEIAAYFTSSTDIGSSTLKEFLVSQLPGYMIPGFFVKLEAFPRTPSGKINLRLLPLPDTNDHPDLSSYVQPVGETEIAIAEAWSEILHREHISSNENFFEIGGNSIKAIRLMSKVQKRLGKKTYLNLIFQHPTIKQMADIIIGTDERLKNMDTEYLLLNQEQEKKVFFLPPGIGYSFAYIEFAKYFDNQTVCGLNFVETADPAKSMADLLIQIQKEGKFYLFGHSAGGNMAYDLAIELQNRGKQVGGIILLDTYRQLELIDWSTEEYLNDAILYIEQNHAEFLDEEIKEAALAKIVAFRKYLNSRVEDIFLNCPIFQIEASDIITNFNQNISRTAWDELTSHFEVYEGSGGHMDMLKQPNLEWNAMLTRRLLDRLFDENCNTNLNDNKK